MKKTTIEDFPKSFNIFWNFKRIEGGFVLNVFTIFRLCTQLSQDFNGKFIQFNIGIYKLTITIQIGIDS